MYVLRPYSPIIVGLLYGYGTIIHFLRYSSFIQDSYMWFMWPGAVKVWSRQSIYLNESSSSSNSVRSDLP